MKRTVRSLAAIVLLVLSGAVQVSAGDSDMRTSFTRSMANKKATRVDTLIDAYLTAGKMTNSRLAEKMAVARSAEGEARVNAILGVLEELLAERTINRWALEDRLKADATKHLHRDDGHGERRCTGTEPATQTEKPDSVKR